MSQYTTDANLAKRIAIHRYGTNPVAWAQWYHEHAPIADGSKVLDIGCGNGTIWRGRVEPLGRSVILVLADSSPGMLDAARLTMEELDLGATVTFVEASIEVLPFDAGSFDLVMANHMLYHAADIPRAIDELARVVKPDGRVLASTNGAGHMCELHRWLSEVGIETTHEHERYVSAFGLENGAALLRRSFNTATLTRYEDSLEVPDPKPVIDYIVSMEPPDSDEAAAALSALEQRLAETVRRHGGIRITKETGLFEAREPRMSVAE
jgi:SAM-dependent methyltransferase